MILSLRRYDAGTRREKFADTVPLAFVESWGQGLRLAATKAERLTHYLYVPSWVHESSAGNVVVAIRVDVLPLVYHVQTRSHGPGETDRRRRVPYVRIHR
jgi:hypothetical protein